MDQTWLRGLAVATASVVVAGGAVVGVSAAAGAGGTSETTEVMSPQQVAALSAMQSDDERMHEAKLHGIEREAQERARIEEERRERLRKEQERAEAERREAERREAERREAERREAERREAEARAARTATRETVSGDPRSIARSLSAERGWGDSQFACLDSLWQRESGWNVYATNPSSGAYGIPQALPGDKMAAYGSDWRTNATTQIEWGLAYIADRYGTPCSAWSAFQSQGWY